MLLGFGYFQLKMTSRLLFSQGSATDDTDSLSSRSLPGSPQTSPPPSRKTTKQENDLYSDDENSFNKAILKEQSEFCCSFSLFLPLYID